MRLNYRYGLCAAAVIGTAALGLGGCGAAAQLPDTIKVQNVENGENQITVSGQEEVKVVPDMAEIVYRVYTQAATAAECQTQNGESLDKALETLKGLGVAETSIQTSSYGLNPIYNWDSGRQEITGYEMDTRITVSDIPMDQAGSILSESVQAGVNQIDSVSYFASNYDEAYQEALKGAMASAQNKAQALAEASGREIAQVSRVEEYGYDPSVRYSAYNAAGSAAGASSMIRAEADMAVMPGQVSVEARVTVDYALK